MGQNFRRNLTHLIKDAGIDAVENALLAVKDLFGDEWLQKKEGHRLQILWSRKDFLSSSELYSLGVAVLNLRKANSTWLESTAKEIKKNIATSHGLITEIVLIGNLSVEPGSQVKPCAKSYPIYDYTIEKGGEVQWKVSIKNFDISNHEREFQKNGDIIREAFQNFLKHYQTSGSLRVVIDGQNLSIELATKICVAIVSAIKEHGYYSFLDHNFSLRYEALPIDGSMTPALPSDIVWIIAPHHYNEQRNIESKIDEANKQMLKDRSSSGAFKHLILRFGASTDLNRVKSYLDEIGENADDCGFDMCILWQPTVTSDIAGGEKLISHTIMLAGKTHYISHEQLELIKNITRPQLVFPIGCVLSEPTRLVMLNHESGEQLPVSDLYTYQKGDIYLKMEKQDDNSYFAPLNSLGAGVKVNAVIPPMYHGHTGKDFIVSCLVDPDHEQLLIL